MEPLNLQTLRYMLFDWDNTLAETRTALVEAVNRVLAEYNMASWDIVKKRRDPSLSFRDNFPHIFGPDLAAEAYNKYVKIYLELIPRLIKTFPAVPETLDFFYDRGIPLIIITNKDRRLLEAELPLLFDRRMFAGIVCGHEAPADKPDPRHIYYSLKGLLEPSQITPENVWMAGDSSQDSSCALSANARAVRIGSPIWPEQECRRKEIAYFNKFKDFLAFLQASC